jgi:hypothetical protein
MSLLNAEIQSLFGQVFGALYLDGEIYRTVLADDPASPGNLIATGAWVAAKIQQDACTQQQQLEEGYSGKDVRLLVLQSGQQPVKPGDKARVLGMDYVIGPVISEDPARSYFQCRGIRV